MAQVHYVSQVFEIGDVVVYCILDASVQVDGQHAFGARRDTAGAEGVAELVVGYFVAQTAA